MEKFQEKPSFFQISLAIIAGVFTFFLFTRTNNIVVLISFGAILIAAINSVLNGLFLGLFTSLAGTIAGIWYFLNKLSLSFKDSDTPEKIASKTSEFVAKQNSISANKIYLVLGVIAIAVLARYIYIKITEKDDEEEDIKEKLQLSDISKQRFSTKKLVYASVFVALSVAINSIRIGSISFGGFPIIFGGIALGPVTGFIIGAVSDLLGFLIRPSSNGFNPAFVLTSALTGMIPIVVLRLIPIKNRMSNFFAVLISIAVGQIITSVIMVPIFRSIFYANPLIVTMPKAFIKQLYSVPLYTVLFINTEQVVLRNINSSLNRKRKRRTFLKSRSEK